MGGRDRPGAAVRLGSMSGLVAPSDKRPCSVGLPINIDGRLGDRMQVDFHDIRRSVIPSALVAGAVRRGKTWVAQCPLHEDRTGSLVSRLTGNGWSYRCFGCGSHGDALDLVAAARGVTAREAGVALLEGSVMLRPLFTGNSVMQVTRPVHSRLVRDDAAGIRVATWLLSRGISPRAVRDVVVAARNDRNAAYCGFVYPGDRVKWRNVDNKPDMFWTGADQVGLYACGEKSTTAVLVEGEIDALSVATLWPLLRAYSVPSGAGTMLREEFVSELTGYENVWVWFDSDGPGQKGAENWLRILPQATAVSCAIGRHKDVNECLMAQCITTVR